MSVSKQALDELCAKLRALELSDEQRLVLDKVLEIAWDYVNIQLKLDVQFDGCFEPEEAAVIMAYPNDWGKESNIINAPQT